MPDELHEIASQKEKMARLRKTEKSNRESGDKESVINFSDLPFVKLLVTADKLERDRASKKFERWLLAQDRLTLLDARKLWKGLFYGILQTELL